MTLVSEPAAAAEQDKPAIPGPAASWGGWVPPAPLQPGPEMAALRRFLFDCTWTGKVHAGGMGPGSPAMEAHGTGTFSELMNGAWLMGTFAQDQLVDGEVIIRWQAYYMVGWVPVAREYRITVVDNTGTTGLMHGWIDGNRFITELTGDAPVKLRMTWELLPDGTVTWANECSVAGAPWFLIEDYTCRPL